MREIYGPNGTTASGLSNLPVTPPLQSWECVRCGAVNSPSCQVCARCTPPYPEIGQPYPIPSITIPGQIGLASDCGCDEWKACQSTVCPRRIQVTFGGAA